MTTAFVNQQGKLAWIVEKNIGSVPEGFTTHEAPEGATPQTHYFNGEEVVEYTEEQRAAKAQVPNYPAIWNDESMSYVDQRTLSDAKIAQNNCINTWWANAHIFMFQDKEFSVAGLGRSNIDAINGYVASTGEFPEDWAGIWKAEDNTTIEMTDIEVWKQFYAAMVAQGNANFLHAQQLKAQLNVAQTISEVEAITW